MIEKLFQIEAPYFTAGLLLIDDVAVQTSPIIKYMDKWSENQLRKYVADRKWKLELIAVHRQTDLFDR